MTMMLFPACGSKTAATTSAAADTSSATASTTSTTSNVDTTSTATDTKKNDPTEMKTFYTTVLKALVTDKTITQAQADTINTKVQEAMKSAQTN